MSDISNNVLPVHPLYANIIKEIGPSLSYVVFSVCPLYTSMSLPV